VSLSEQVPVPVPAGTGTGMNVLATLAHPSLQLYTARSLAALAGRGGGRPSSRAGRSLPGAVRAVFRMVNDAQFTGAQMPATEPEL
jgi:hypothetical protein